MAKLLSQLTSEILAAAAMDEDIGRSRKSGKANVGQRTQTMISDDLKVALNDISDKDAGAVKLFLNACMQHGSRTAIDKLAMPVLETKNIVNWKDHGDIICLVLDALLSGDNADKAYRRYYSEDFINSLMKLIKRNGLTHTAQPKLLIAIQFVLEHAGDVDKVIPSIYSKWSYKSLVSAYPWRDNYKDAINTLEILIRLIKRNPRLKKNDICSVFMTALVENDSVKFLIEINETVAEVFKLSAQQPLIVEKERTNCFQLLEDIMRQYLDRHSTPKLAAALMPDVKMLWRCGVHDLEREAERVILNYAGTYELVDDIIDTLLDMALTGENTSHISNLSKTYPKCPGIFHARFDEVVYALRAAGSRDQSSLLDLLWSIAKLHPEVFTPKSVTVISECLDGDSAVHMVFLVFKSLAEYQPEMVYCHFDTIKESVDRLGDSGIGALNMFVPLSFGNQDRAVACLDYLASMLPSMTLMYKPTVIYYMRSIGVEWPAILAEHRETFDQLKLLPGLRDSINSVLDVIDGRSLGNVAQTVSEQQHDINQLDTRLNETGDNLENMAKEMDARPKRKGTTPPPDNAKESDHDLLLKILNKLNVVEEMNHKMTKIDSRMTKMEKRLRNVEIIVSEISAREATNV